MATRYNRYGERPTGQNRLTAFLLAALCVSIFGVVLYSLRERRAADDDMTRALQLRAEASDVRVSLAALSPDSPERARLESRHRELAAEHNAILARHPTWTLAPLEPPPHPMR